MREDINEEGSSVITPGGDMGGGLRRASREPCAHSGYAAYCDAVGRRASNRAGNADAAAAHFRTSANVRTGLDLATADACSGVAAFDAYG